MRDGEERGVRHRPRLAAAELVVSDHRPVVAEGFEWFQVVAAETRTSMDQNEWRPRPGSRFLIPDLAIGNRQHRLSRRERSCWCGLRCDRSAVRLRLCVAASGAERRNEQCG